MNRVDVCSFLELRKRCTCFPSTLRFCGDKSAKSFETTNIRWTRTEVWELTSLLVMQRLQCRLWLLEVEG